MLPELTACQIFIDLGNVQGCFTIQLHRLQGDSDPHWQCLINHRHSVLTALSFLSSIQAIGELFSNHYCLCFSFKKKKIIKSRGIKKGRIWWRGEWCWRVCAQKVDGILRAANRSHVSHSRLAKMPSSARRFCYGGQIRQYLSSVESSRQACFPLVCVLAADLSACLPITRGTLVFATDVLVDIITFITVPGG